MLALVSVMTSSEKQLLKGVSRSFYLSLRVLPMPMRGAASLGYLLARASDTLADVGAIPAAARLANLDAFRAAITQGAAPPRWSATLFNSISNPKERILLESTEDLFAWLQRLPENEARLVREVVSIIIGGQMLDIERFGDAHEDHPICLRDDAELDDYTWRVAGCVGVFWTKLGFLTLGDRFSKQAPEGLIAQATEYGKGLQLVNILRDMAADLTAGRCYLPVTNPQDSAQLMVERERWLKRANECISKGFSYAEALSSRRLRAASVLPAMLARETLRLISTAGSEAMQQRIKVSRSYVYLAMARAFTYP